MDKNRICMVGDRLDTDIKWAVDFSLGSVLVLTGVTSERMLLSEQSQIIPEVYMSSLADFLTVESQLVN